VFGKRKKQVVGCDVGSSSIKIVELKPLKNGEYQLVHAAIANLSPEAIVDGAIMDSSLVVEALSRLIADAPQARKGVAGQLPVENVARLELDRFRHRRSDEPVERIGALVDDDHRRIDHYRAIGLGFRPREHIQRTALLPRPIFESVPSGWLLR